MNDLSLYIHIPFCVKKCYYCDFLSAPATTQVQEQYFHALLQEIQKRSEGYEDYQVKTIFIGGGTPSLFKPEWITSVMEMVQKHFCVLSDAEISMEMNPGTVKGREAFAQYKKAGINRISIGLQSTDDEELARLGRIHTFAQFKETWQMARQAGFDNLNIDVMAALPGQTIASYEKTLRTVCELRPEHISAYSLILEEGTPFFEQYAYLPDDEETEERDRQMYVLTKELLENYGYHRYEISNYAQPGKECRHNQVYWQRGNYLGLGIGAASLINNTRYHNASDLSRYIQAGGLLPYEEVQSLSRQEQMEEFFFLGMRLTKGISRAEFKQLYGCPAEAVYGEVLKKNQKDGLLTVEEERISLTEKGLDLSNYVFAQFLQ